MAEGLPIVMAGGYAWVAHEQIAYTMIIGDDGTEYIRSLKGGWVSYHEPELFEPLSRMNDGSDDDDDELEENDKTKRITAYNIFMKITLKTISKKYPDMPCKDRMKLAAEMWKDAKNENIYKIKIQLK